MKIKQKSTMVLRIFTTIILYLQGIKLGTNINYGWKLLVFLLSRILLSTLLHLNYKDYLTCSTILNFKNFGKKSLLIL